MEPLPINPIVPPATSRDDSAAEEARAAERRTADSRAGNFQRAMQRGPATPPPTPAKGAAANKTTSNSKAPTADPRRAPSGQPLSPSLMKLRADMPRDAEPIHPAVSKVSPEAVEHDGAHPAEIGRDSAMPGVSTPATADTAKSLDPSAILQNAKLQGRKTNEADDCDSASETRPAEVEQETASLAPADASGIPPRFRPESVPPGQRVLPPLPLLQQVVEFATVTQNADGFMEFNLGLANNTLGGLRIKVSSFGKRRIGLSIRSRASEGGVGDAEVAGLVEALRNRGVEVVEVSVE